MADRVKMLEAVAEAARAWLNVVSQLPYQDQRELDAMSVCENALNAVYSIDALPAEPVGETVTMALIRATKTGDFAGTMHPDQEDPRDWEHVGNLVFHAPARVTLPTITARVET